MQVTAAIAETDVMAGTDGEPDPRSLTALRLRRDCVQTYAEAVAEYRAIEPRLTEIRVRHRARPPLNAAQRGLVGSLPERGLRHGIMLTRVAGALDLIDRDSGVGAGEIAEDLMLMRRPVRLLADMYVLMIAVASAEDVFGLPYVDPDLLPEYA
jgi:hypothetical protein